MAEFKPTLNTSSSLAVMSMIQEATIHIFDTVAHQVVRTILDRANIYHLFKDTVSVGSDHTAPVTLVDKHSNPLLQRVNRASCVYTTNLEPDSLKWTTSYDRLTSTLFDRTTNTMLGAGRTSPVFYDAKSATVVHINRIPTGMTLDLILEFKDRNVAGSAFDVITGELDVNNPGIYFDVVYDYPLPRDIVCILYRILQLKGLPPASFVDALKTYSSGWITTAKNVKTNKQEVVVHEPVSGIMAQIDLASQAPVGIKDGNKVISWQIQLSISLQFARPHLASILYPIVVNNTLIPSDIITIHPEDLSVYENPKSPFINEELYRQLLNEELTTITCVKLPWYDPWRPTYKAPCTLFGYQPILSMVVTLETDAEGTPTGSTSIDLSDLGDITLIEDVITHIEDDQGSCLFYNGKYNLAVYANEYQVEQSMLTLNGTVLTIPHVDRDKAYRVVLSVKEAVLNASLNSARVLIFDIYTGRNS